MIQNIRRFFFSIKSKPFNILLNISKDIETCLLFWQLKTINNQNFYLGTPRKIHCSVCFIINDRNLQIKAFPKCTKRERKYLMQGWHAYI